MERWKSNLSPLFRPQVRSALAARFGGSEKAEQNCLYRLDINTPGGWVRVKQFTNGTLYVEATDTAAFSAVLAEISAVTGMKITPTLAAPASASSGPKKAAVPGAIRGKIEVDEAYIGTDESGKGDYFGALVVAGVFVTPETVEILADLGVMDSKLLKDDAMRPLAAAIKNCVGPDGFHIIEMGPRRYNELYAKFKSGGKNLNHLLAWAHAKTLETLLEKNPNCALAIADQFGSEHYIITQLQTRGQKIRLHQTPKAEANTGVAAASILARVHFIDKLDALGRPWGMKLPPGAGSNVVAAARTFVSRHGADALMDVAKCHFKTTETVLGHPLILSPGPALP